MSKRTRIKTLLSVLFTFIIFSYGHVAMAATLVVNNSQISPNEAISITVGDLSGDHDWVGIYHKNDSNDWANVLSWDWVDSGTSTLDGVAGVGEYEARLFFHNSFHMEASAGFNIATLTTSKSSYLSGETINMTLAGLSGDRDWVGIYHKNDSNDWANVLSWDWANNSALALQGIADAGEYEARLFFHNSYKTESLSSFSIEDEDAQYLYQDLNITQNNDVIIVNNANDNLMYASKNSFVRTNLDKFSVENKNFTEVLGGFNVEFDIKNTTNEGQSLTFTIEIPGIDFTDNNQINILNTLTYMVPVSRTVEESEVINGQFVSNKAKVNLRVADNATSYPDGYSPVILAHDGKLAVGASMLTTYKNDELALKQFVEHYSNGSWSFIFKNAGSANGNDGAGVRQFGAKWLESGELQHFNIAIRFANVSGDKNNNWIYTLSPYKQFFKQEFPMNERDIVERDTRPILGMTFAYEGLVNHPGYDDNNYKKKAYADTFAHLNNYNPGGVADTYVQRLKAKMTNNNYERVMFWSVSGMYYGDQYDHPENYNLPPQFLGNLLPNIQNVISEIQNELGNSDIDYGFWWGRAGQIPVKNGHIIGDGEWNPDEILRSNINNNPYHSSFAKYQLQKAIDYGANEVGLDAFINMENSAQFEWIREMKTYARNQGRDIKFMQEGKMCDYLHTQFSMYLQPHNAYFNASDLRFSSEPVLANYLNPNAEIITWIEKSNQQNEDYINDLRELGFTPLLNISDGRVNNIPPYSE